MWDDWGALQNAGEAPAPVTAVVDPALAAAGPFLAVLDPRLNALSQALLDPSPAAGAAAAATGGSGGGA